MSKSDDFEFFFKIFVEGRLFADEVAKGEAGVWWTDVFFDEITEFLLEGENGVWWVWFDDF